MSAASYILALDQGTTSSRSIVFNAQGGVVSVAQKEFKQLYPTPGWVEHDPYEIWASQSATLAEAVARANLDFSAIAAIGITNQRETTIVWEADTGKPVYNAIVWQDRRTAGLCDQLKRDGVEAMVSERTGLRIDPYFSGTKIRWILDNVPGARAQAEAGKLRFGTVDTWLVWQLTHGRLHLTDATNASRTLLCNLRTGQWDREMLSLLKIPESMLPQIRSSSEPYGQVDASLIPTQAPIAGIAGDQHAALFGQACFSPGMAKNTYGTGCFLLMQTGTEPIASKNNLVTTIAWKIGHTLEYALEGSVFIGGAAVQWLRDEMKLVRDVKELNELAESVPDAGGLFLVPAFAGLGAPHWDPYARGAALGITRGTNRAHFCRAALEAIAFQSADLISAMEKDSGLTLKELRVDGGACRSNTLMQFQADLLGTPVLRPRNVETTALGAAYLAGLAVGFWKSREEIAQQATIEATFRRKRPEAEMAKLKTGWAKAVERAKQWESPL